MVSMWIRSGENENIYYNLATAERILIDPQPESDGKHRVKIRYAWSKVATYLEPDEVDDLVKFLGA